MSVQGDVRGIGLAELLQGLARGQKEGILTLTASGTQRAVLGIEDGQAWLLPDPDEDPQVWTTGPGTRGPMTPPSSSPQGDWNRSRRRDDWRPSTLSSTAAASTSASTLGASATGPRCSTPTAPRGAASTALPLRWSSCSSSTPVSRMRSSSQTRRSCQIRRAPLHHLPARAWEHAPERTGGV